MNKNSVLTGRKITVGIAGGIAAYKTAELVSGLVKSGAKVRVVMTAAAQRFIAPLTFSALTGNSVHREMFDTQQGGVTHIELAQDADMLVIAPATANIIAKAANGIADDLLSTVVLAANCPVVFCPAMNNVMYNNPVVQRNVNRLRKLGYQFIGPNSGFLACGTSGAGRMSEPAEILQSLIDLLAPGDLEGVKILVSAGPTREPIDPVRYITNRSSGKMGYSIARAAAERGADVVLVSGPVNLEPPSGVEVINVETAQEMHRALMNYFSAADVVIMAAAVADYCPSEVAGEKIKKNEDALVLNMQKNPDILAEMGRLKTRQFIVGFAAETNQMEEYAKHKLVNKNLDLLVANDITIPGAGFDVDTNIVMLFHRNGKIEKLPLMSKYEVAGRILDELLTSWSVQESE